MCWEQQTCDSVILGWVWVPFCIMQVSIEQRRKGRKGRRVKTKTLVSPEKMESLQLTSCYEAFTASLYSPSSTTPLCSLVFLLFGRCEFHYVCVSY